MIGRVFKFERGVHQWRQQAGQCKCEECVRGFIADFLKGKASIYDYRGGDFRITEWSASNRLAWQSDKQPFICVACGYPLDWRHSDECNYHPELERDRSGGIGKRPKTEANARTNG